MAQISKLVAIKKQSLENPELLKYIHSEIDILKSIRHPNVLRYIGICFEKEKDCLYIITEFLEGGDLRNFIQDASSPSQMNTTNWALRVKIVMDVANAIYYLHSHNLMHRDIKTDNVILSENHRCVLCDFGFATFVDKSKRRMTLSSEEYGRAPQRTMSFCGTDEFMSPEEMFGMRYGFPSDVFSYGILIAEVVSGKIPGVEGHLVRYPQHGFCFEDDDELRNLMPKDAPYSLVELCIQCCAAEPDDRPTAYDAYEWARELYDELKGDISNGVENVEESSTSAVHSIDDTLSNNVGSTTSKSLSTLNMNQEESRLSLNEVVDGEDDVREEVQALKPPRRKKPSRRKSSVIKAGFNGRSFELDRNLLSLAQTIRTSNYASTHQGTYGTNSVFVKIINIHQWNDGNDGGKIVENHFAKELDILRTLSHTNIVKYIVTKFDKNENKLYLCMEYLSGGTLHEFLSSKRGGLNSTFPWTLKLHFASELVSAVKHLHNRNIVHKDLRSSKIMLSSGMRLVVSYTSIWEEGFSLSSSEEQTESNRGNFCAPEIYLKKDRASRSNFTFATDIFSVGLILLEIGCGKQVSGTFPKRDAKNNYSIAESEFLSQHVDSSESKSDDISRKYYGICANLCQLHPSSRPSAFDLHSQLAALSYASHTATTAQNALDSPKTQESKALTRRKMYRRGETSPVLNTEAKNSVDVHSLAFMKTGEYSFAGILNKRGRWNPQWKSRAFAIRKSAIDYFRYSDVKTQQIGSLPFDSLMVFEEHNVALPIPNKSQLFKLCTQKRTYILQANE